MTVRVTTAEVFAPAKVNLALHVVGRRADGYHLLDSLVAFADVGDRMSLAETGRASLAVEGPFAKGVPADDTNLVARALRAVDAPPLSVRLIKNLPPASGIGGGSSDAAAAVRGAAALDSEAPKTIAKAHATALLALGADIPMCLDPQPARITGIGEQIAPVRLPDLPAVLINPLVEVPTGAVFQGLSSTHQPLLTDPPEFARAGDVINWLYQQRNDLQDCAIGLCPEIGTCLDALAASQGCLLARMSGSGATCFGLYDTTNAAESAAKRLALAHQGWWVRSARLGDMRAVSRPTLS